MSKSQVFVAKSDKLSNPWYTDSWKEKDKVAKVDKFVIDQVTCKDVTDMRCMFDNCASFNQPLNDWNVSNVTDMSFMFCWCGSFNQDISNWSVSNVKNNRKIFHNCPIEEKHKPKFK